MQKEPFNSNVVDREDTYQQLLQYIKEGKLDIEDAMKYYYVDQLFKGFNKNVQLNSKHFEFALSIYFEILKQVNSISYL